MTRKRKKTVVVDIKQVNDLKNFSTSKAPQPGAVPIDELAGKLNAESMQSGEINPSHFFQSLNLKVENNIENKPELIRLYQFINCLQSRGVETYAEAFIAGFKSEDKKALINNYEKINRILSIFITFIQENAYQDDHGNLLNLFQDLLESIVIYADQTYGRDKDSIRLKAQNRLSQWKAKKAATHTTISRTSEADKAICAILSEYRERDGAKDKAPYFVAGKILTDVNKSRVDSGLTPLKQNALAKRISRIEKNHKI